MPDTMTLGEAARELGVDYSTIRRWRTAGRIRATRPELGRRGRPWLVERAEVERLRELMGGSD